MTCRKRSLGPLGDLIIRSNLNSRLQALQARWEGPHFSDLWTFAIGADASDLEALKVVVVRTRVVNVVIGTLLHGASLLYITVGIIVAVVP